MPRVAWIRTSPRRLGIGLRLFTGTRLEGRTQTKSRVTCLTSRLQSFSESSCLDLALHPHLLRPGQRQAVLRRREGLCSLGGIPEGSLYPQPRGTNCSSNNRDGAQVTKRGHLGMLPSIHFQSNTPHSWHSMSPSSQSSDSSSEDSDSDHPSQPPRGRTDSLHSIGSSTTRRSLISNGTHKRQSSPNPHSSSQSGSSRRSSPVRARQRIPFTRSRSPAVHIHTPLNGSGPPLPDRTSSPTLFSRSKHAHLTRLRHLFPGQINLNFRFSASTAWTVSIDVRQAIENCLLLCSLGFIAVKLRTCTDEQFSPDGWISIGGLAVVRYISIVVQTADALSAQKYPYSLSHQ